MFFILQWLSETFLGYLDRWEKSVEEREGEAKALGAETMLGLRITGKTI